LLPHNPPALFLTLTTRVHILLIFQMPSSSIFAYTFKALSSVLKNGAGVFKMILPKVMLQGQAGTDLEHR
jgi:hypothetical protein